MPRNKEQSFSIRGAGGMDAANVLLTGNQELLTVKQEKNSTQRQWPGQEP